MHQINPDFEYLKLQLTNTVTKKEIDFNATNELKYIQDFYNHYIKGNAYTMLPIIRLDNIQLSLRTILNEKILGDVIETGVWRGGATIFMRSYLKAYEDNRTVWVADSFEGLPKPERDFPLELASHNSPIFKKYNHFAVSLEEVKENFRKFGVLDDSVKFLVGWFKDTLPNAPIEKLSLMRLDGDYYHSTMQALNSLYPKLSPGGFCIVDDYGEEKWTNCKWAVEDYRYLHGIKDKIISVDSKCVFWRKSNG